MFNTHFRSLISICLISLITLLWTGESLAQDASNRRGFQPGNSFAIGDFETINTTNGNLMLRFPLGGLPAGRNGLTAGINLFYNSKLLDSETQYFRKENEECEIVGGAGEGVLVCPYYQKQVLKESEQGGWQFGAIYSLKLIDRHDQFNNIPWEQRPRQARKQPWAGPGERLTMLENLLRCRHLEALVCRLRGARVPPAQAP